MGIVAMVSVKLSSYTQGKHKGRELHELNSGVVHINMGICEA